jgi:hypothetical protein
MLKVIYDSLFNEFLILLLFQKSLSIPGSNHNENKNPMNIEDAAFFNK